MLILIITVVVMLGIYLAKPKVLSEKNPAGEDIHVNDIILADNIAFFRGLDKTRQQQFEKEVLEFLSEVRITGVDTTVDDLDKILVASSAVIPVFAFPEWTYTNLQEAVSYTHLTLPTNREV